MYRQLTLEQRLIIEQMYARKASQSAIARKLRVHRSTVKRELDRNSTKGKYHAQQAHSNAICRKKISGTITHLFSQDTKLVKGAAKQSKRNTSSERLRLRRFRSRRKQFRLKRYEPYIPRPDERPYKLHPNKRRTRDYHKWKSAYEKQCRFRDNAKAEQDRTPRSRKDFLSYIPQIKRPELRYAKQAHLAWRKYKRLRYELAGIRKDRYMRELEERLLRIKHKEAFEMLESSKTPSPKARKTLTAKPHPSNDQTQNQQRTFLYLIWSEPDIVKNRSWYRRLEFG